MRLNPPTYVVFMIALALAVLALLGHFRVVRQVPQLAQYQFWLAIASYATLAIGCVMRGR